MPGEVIEPTLTLTDAKNFGVALDMFGADFSGREAEIYTTGRTCVAKLISNWKHQPRAQPRGEAALLSQQQWEIINSTRGLFESIKNDTLPKVVYGIAAEKVLAAAEQATLIYQTPRAAISGNTVWRYAHCEEDGPLEDCHA